MSTTLSRAPRAAVPGATRAADTPNCARQVLRRVTGFARMHRPRRAKGVFGVCLAIPGHVIEVVDEANSLARVDVAGVRRNVNVGLLDGSVRAGDWVLIHVGFALSRVDEEEAQATLALLQKMGEAYEQELEDLKASAIE
jgi:hydrogenase expression/formation protein HypC